MSEKINTNQGDTNVKNNIIDFSTIETKDRTDDVETWNSLRFMGETDENEARYESPEEPSKEALDRIKRASVGAKIFEAFNMKAA